MLRKVILSMMAAGVLTAQADSFSFLTIEKTDGTAQSLTAVGLTINYSNGNLVATIALTDISRMYFSNEQAITSAISTVNTSTPTSETNPQSDGIYNLQGHRVASLSQRSSLRKGIYIIVENGQTKKVQVK